MSLRIVLRSVLVCGIFTLVSCSTKYEGPKIKKVPVVPVHGTITIDGKAEANVIVRCVPIGKFEPADLLNSLGGQTDADGAFKLSTYESGDGVPPAEYALTIIWPEPTLKKRSREAELKEDRLKGRYGNAAKPFKKIIVKADEPLEIEELALSTK